MAPPESKHPVWPYFFLSVISLIAACTFMSIWWPASYPAKSELIKVSGEINSMVVKDEISKTGAGAMLPTLTAVYFTLEGVQGEFKYPFTHPKYPLVRDNTSGTLEIWVEKAKMNEDLTMTIWQLREHSTYNYVAPPTKVDYEEIVERLRERDRSMFDLGLMFLIGTAVLGLAGIGVRRWNRHGS